MPRKKSYTILEAARKLGITRAAVHKAIKASRLKARYKMVKLRAWLIDAEALKSYQVSISHQEAGKKQFIGLQ